MTDPHFSREAGRVISGAYFAAPPADLSGEPLIKWWNERHAERRALERALDTAERYDDLAPDARAIYDRALDAAVNEAAQQDVYDRLHGADYS